MNRDLENIMYWILETDIGLELRMGVCDMGESSWYATINRRQGRQIPLAERRYISTWGSKRDVQGVSPGVLVGEVNSAIVREQE